MNKFVKPILFLLLVGIFFVCIFLTLLEKEKSHRQDIIVSGPDNIELKTQVAESSAERSIGLSTHTSLDEDEAMLFVFSSLGNHGFWMKDMSFSIDIFWLDEDKEIIFIKESAHPDDYPEIYSPTEPALYVLETVEGFAQKFQLEEGDVFSW